MGRRGEPSPRKSSRAVSFNFRVYRDDGRPMSGRKVLAALEYFVAHRRMPDGVHIEAVNWQRPAQAKRHAIPGHPTRDGETAMLEHFYNIIRARGLSSLRLGAVKESDL